MLVSLSDDTEQQYPFFQALRRHSSVGAELLVVLKLDVAVPVVWKPIEMYAIKYTGCEVFIWAHHSVGNAIITLYCRVI